MPKTATKTRSIYSVHPGVAITQKWIADLKEKTGRTLEEWIKHIKKVGPKTEKERREWLKTEHGLGTNTSWYLAEPSVGKGEEVSDPNHYLEAAEQYLTLASEAGVSIEPGVERSGTPGSMNKKAKARETGDSARFDINILNAILKTPGNAVAIARFTGSTNHLVAFLGFRCASPQALCCHPLRGLRPSY
ncbi:MAG: DUF4287 domain-containing protein [Pyrinomonadaceae bacterium]